MGKLDEISEAIGGLRSTVASQQQTLRNIEKGIEGNREVQSRRHTENSAAIAAIELEQKSQGEKLDRQGKKLDQQAQQLAALQFPGAAPGAQITRSRMAVYTTIGVGTVALLGWMCESFVKWAVNAALSHWH
jgi:hypothetical protein